jgi:hypothetical protein
VATFETVRRIALSLPGVEEGPCYGTPAFRVKGKLFARLKEDGETLVLRTDFEAREALLEARPETYFITDHYAGHEWILVRLGAVTRPELEDRITSAWRSRAPARLIAALGDAAS